MTNKKAYYRKKYQKGARKERKIMNEAKEQGKLAFRSAGSRSPIDVVIIDKEKKYIQLIQAKSDNISKKEKKRLLNEQCLLNDFYIVRFIVK